MIELAMLSTIAADISSLTECRPALCYLYYRPPELAAHLTICYAAGNGDSLHLVHKRASDAILHPQLISSDCKLSEISRAAEAGDDTILLRTPDTDL